MKPHLVHRRVYLTPLTPVHIGCGEDYEPTNYVIDGGVLFHFDPARVSLDGDDRVKLDWAVNQSGDKAILALQKFFYERKARYGAASRLSVPVTGEVCDLYESRIGQVAQFEVGGGRIANRLEIERTVHHPVTGTPYIPGSALKGAIRTAWLNSRDNIASRPLRDDGAPLDKSADLELSILGGAFSEDPFRQLKVSDAAGVEVGRMVVLSVDRALKHRLDPKTGRPRESDLKVRREVILGGQHRALACDFVLDNLGELADQSGLPARRNRIAAFEDVARACNEFYRSRIEREMARYERFAGEDWAGRFRRLLQALEPAFDAGDAWLVRVGRNCGAESVTLERHRRIRIKGKQSKWSKEPTTVWLMQRERPDRLLPFGWVLVEAAALPENPALRTWCDEQPKPDFAALAQALEVRRASWRADEVRRREKRAAEEAEVAAEAARAAERAARTAALGENGRRVEAVRARFESHTGPRQSAGGQLFAELKALRKLVDEEAWPAEDRAFVAEALGVLALEKIQFPKQQDKEFRRWFAALKGETGS